MDYRERRRGRKPWKREKTMGDEAERRKEMKRGENMGDEERKIASSRHT